MKRLNLVIGVLLLLLWLPIVSKAAVLQPMKDAEGLSVTTTKNQVLDNVGLTQVKPFGESTLKLCKDAKLKDVKQEVVAQKAQ